MSGAEIAAGSVVTCLVLGYLVTHLSGIMPLKWQSWQGWLVVSLCLPVTFLLLAFIAGLF